MDEEGGVPEVVQVAVLSSMTVGVAEVSSAYRLGYLLSTSTATPEGNGIPLVLFLPKTS